MHRHDKKTFRCVQDLCVQFMQEGRNQYMTQAQRWQQLYDEQGADLEEMQQKLIEMD